jgi:hypothetical protein
MYRRLLYLALGVALFGAGYVAGSMPAAPVGAGTAMQPPNCQTFRETGKTVCGRFLRYWLEHGGLAQQGFPISQEFQERSDLNGQTYTVQYFERAVFEFHPENRPPFDVLLSQLGTFQYRAKYGAGGPPPTATTPPLPPAPTASAPIFANVGEPVRRDGMVFTVRRIDVQSKRVDVPYTIRNETGGPVTFTLDKRDQHLLDNTGGEYDQSDPGGVATITLANGQNYESGNTFNADLTGKGVKELIFAIDRLPRIGSVRVTLPLEP